MNSGRSCIRRFLRGCRRHHRNSAWLLCRRAVEMVKMFDAKSPSAPRHGSGLGKVPENDLRVLHARRQPFSVRREDPFPSPRTVHGEVELFRVFFLCPCRTSEWGALRQVQGGAHLPFTASTFPSM